MLANILDGIMNAISMGSLLANLMGVTLGIIFGALPGLTAAMGVALLIPLTFGMPAVEAFSALLGMYVGAIYGGGRTPHIPAQRGRPLPPFSSARRVLCPPPRPCLKAPPSRPAENPAGLWTWLP